MNENNLEYLKKTLDGLGFGTKLNDVLESAIKRELPKFSLGITTQHRPLDNKDVNAAKTEHINFTLNFNRSQQSDMYFLNDYKVLLQKSNEALPRIQTFDLERDYRITTLQAYKLLSGLSLEKDVFLRSKAEAGQAAARPQEKTPIWFRLNLDVTDADGNHPVRTFRPEYGYDLRETLGKYPIKGFDTPDKLEEALKTLRNGNYYHAELQLGKKNVPVSIAANPQMKTIDIYDKNLMEIRDEVIFPEKNKAKETSRQPAAALNKTAQQQSNAPGTDKKVKEQAIQQPEQPWAQEPEQDKGPKRGR